MSTIFTVGDFCVGQITAEGGNGKSYMAVAWLVLERLQDYNLPVWTNLPLRVDAIAEYVAKKRGCDPQEVRDRINIIPQEMLQQWARGEGGPWDLVPETGGEPADLIIDEAHVFCQPWERGELGRKWSEFLGEIRHHKFEVVLFLTQGPEKLHSSIHTHSHVRVWLSKAGLKKGWQGIRLGDVYEMIAAYTGLWWQVVQRMVEVKSAGKWKANEEEAIVLRHDIWRLYDTHSKAGGSSEAANQTTAKVPEHKRRPRFIWAKTDYRRDGRDVWTAPMWAWFAKRNVFATAGLIGVFVITNLLCLYGPFALPRLLASGVRMAYFTGGGSEDVRNEDGGLEPVVADKSDDRGGGCGCGAKKNALIVELRERLEIALAQAGENPGLVALSPRAARFAGGVVVRLGGVIKGGPYDGETVQEIDFGKRYCRLSGSGWVSVGQAAAPDANPELRDLLRRVEIEVLGDDAAAGRGTRPGGIDRDQRRDRPRTADHAQPGERSIIRR